MKQPFTVLITGMGAFPDGTGGRYLEDDNASHLIANLLPASLPPFSKHNSTSTEIRILNPTRGKDHAVKTEYGFVRSYCEQIWREHGHSVDVIIHLGMADGWEFFVLEEGAYKEGTSRRMELFDGQRAPLTEYYSIKDDIGQTIHDLPPLERATPTRLFAGPDLNVAELAGKVEETMDMYRIEGDKVEVRSHPDAGPYLCGFLSYESFAQGLLHGYKARALFLHVPSWRDEKRLQLGREFVCFLVGEIAAALLDGKM